MYKQKNKLTDNVTDKSDKLLIPVIKNIIRMLIASIIASLLITYNPTLYVIDMLITIIVIMSFSILRDLSQSTRLYGNYFKDITAHNIVLSWIIYLGGCLCPGILYVVQLVMS